MTLKIKIISITTMFCLMLVALIVGIYASQTQTITLSGSINFEIADKSLYVQDVRMQNGVTTPIYSLKENGDFYSGYINGEFNMYIGEYENNYGTFLLYFDIINTVGEDNTSNMYSATATSSQSGVSVNATIDNYEEYIPEGTISPEDITSSTEATATLKVEVTSSAGTEIDLSQITITLSVREPTVYDYFSFSVTDRTNHYVELASYSGSLSDVKIPSTVSQNSNGEWIDGNDYKVTSIDNYVFDSNTAIKNVDFPPFLTQIGYGAFYNCQNLVNINLENCKNLKNIGGETFYNCAFESITLPNSLTSIEDNLFESCKNLTEIYIPSNITSIGINSFAQCSSLKSVTLPSSLEIIVWEAFSYCRSLTFIDFSNCTNLSIIDDSAFYGCSSLTSIDLSNCTNLSRIENYVFRECTNLITVVFPSTTGWYVTTSSTATSGTNIDVTNPEQNAIWFTGEYSMYYFKRNI